MPHLLCCCLSVMSRLKLKRRKSECLNLGNVPHGVMGCVNDITGFRSKVKIARMCKLRHKMACNSRAEGHRKSDLVNCFIKHM